MSIFVVDTCTLRELLFHFNLNIPAFNNMWNKFEFMIESGEVIFVKESFRELDLQIKDKAEEKKWILKYKKFFLAPNNDECNLVSEIYKNKNFQYNIRQKNILKGRPVADAFIVAKAKIIGSESIVVSNETYSPNAAKIPNICEAFEINYIHYKDFVKILFSSLVQSAERA